MASSTNKVRGYAVLISNEKFPLMNAERVAYPGQKLPDPTRKGAEEDDNNLLYVFGTKLKFNFLEKRTYRDITKYPYESTDRPFWIHNDGKAEVDKTTCRCLSCKIQTTDHSQSECFVLAISTHGVKVKGEQEICLYDDLHVDRLKLSDIINALSDDNCKTLQGKPRIILLQLCRSNPYVREEHQEMVWKDPGHPVTVGAESMPNLDSLRISGAGDKIMKTNVEGYYEVTEHALQNLPPNFLIIFPCVSGKKAIHNFRYGSWLIDELRKAVEGHDFEKTPEMDFLSVLTLTAGRVARDREGDQGQKSAVCLVHRLLKPLIFKDIPESAEDEPNLTNDSPTLL